MCNKPLLCPLVMVWKAFHKRKNNKLSFVDVQQKTILLPTPPLLNIQYLITTKITTPSFPLDMQQTTRLNQISISFPLSLALTILGSDPSLYLYFAIGWFHFWSGWARCVRGKGEDMGGNIGWRGLFSWEFWLLASLRVLDLDSKMDSRVS